MKVINVTEFYSERGGGVRSHLTHKQRVSCQLGHESIVVAPGPRDSEERFADGSRVIRIGGAALPYDPTYHLLWRVDRIRAIVARERPDVLEIDSPYVAAAGALAASRDHFGVRTFVWHTDFIDTYAGVLLGHRATPARRAIVGALVKPLWSMVRAIARRCDATFVAGRWMEAKLHAHGVERVRFVPFGVEHASFSPAAKSADVRRELLGGAKPGAALLVGVGRFAIEKRWDVVLDAFIAFRKTRDAVLVLYGDGPERVRMEARVAGRDDVRFVGFEKDRAKLAAALASADALVHGCPFETFGFAVAEAMSAGLPVVVPDQGGAAELADDACAERYPSGDVLACADAITRLLARAAGDRQTMRDAAVRAAARVPSVRAQFERMFDVYAELLSSRSS